MLHRCRTFSHAAAFLQRSTASPALGSRALCGHASGQGLSLEVRPASGPGLGDLRPLPWAPALGALLASGGSVFCSCSAEQQGPELVQPASARPAPGPGSNVNPAALRAMWKAMPDQAEVIEFYDKKGIYGCFSNFYDQNLPFDFVIPQEFFGDRLVPEKDRTYRIAYSEKAIMLCKAAVMGDGDSLAKIAAAVTPAETKALGRGVQGFNQKLWSQVVCSVAYEIVHQKFRKTPELREVLLMTGDAVLVEASPWDANWGIGMGKGDPRARIPSQWLGTNILGWALMEARTALRN